MEKETILDVKWATLWRLFTFGILIIVFYLTRDVLGTLFAGMVISLGLEPIINFLHERRIPRLLGTITVFLSFLLLFGFTFYFIMPIFFEEAGKFIDEFNQLLSLLFGFRISEFNFVNLTSGFEKIVTTLKSSDLSIGGLSTALKSSVLFLLAIIVTFRFMLEKDGIEKFLRAVLPDAYENSILRIFHRFKIKIRRWLIAQAALSLIVGLLIGIGLWLLGVKYPLILGFLAALFEIVPIIGPVFIGVMAFLVAIPESMTLGLYVILLFILVNQLESHVLTPLIVGRTMSVNPIIVMVALVGGAEVAGLLGVILAVPIAVIIQEIFFYLAEQKSQKTPLGF
ncbi:MAG: AI-2E family transporter [bacterium]|nr:AI-2E family transporter [bacterium]